MTTVREVSRPDLAFLCVLILDFARRQLMRTALLRARLSIC